MDEPKDDLKQQCDEYLNSWKRAAADLINYKKDEGRRMEEFAEYSAMKILKELLPVLDSFAALERVAQGEPRPETGRELEGLMAIKKQLEDFLKKQNVERIKVSPGDSLDLNVHEPVLEVESADHPELAGKIIEELSPGYKLGSRVIRPVKVKINK